MADVSNYRPISNLSVVSKLLERAVCSQLVAYLDEANLMPPNQSAYRKCHSTDTALTVVFFLKSSVNLTKAILFYYLCSTCLQLLTA